MAVMPVFECLEDGDYDVAIEMESIFRRNRYSQVLRLEFNDETR
jgi:hypothetical protein